MLSSVEAWWAGLCALPFDGAQGDSLFLVIILSLCLFISYYFSKMTYLIKNT